MEIPGLHLQKWYCIRQRWSKAHRPGKNILRILAYSTQVWRLKTALDAVKGLTSLLEMALDMQFSNNVTHSRRKLVFWEEKFIKSNSDLLKLTEAQSSA